MKVIRWESGIVAPWKRALELKDLRMSGESLHVEVEEESGKSWSLDFKPVQAWKVTSEECAGKLLAELTLEGSLFLVHESEWRKELDGTGVVEKSKHFIVCCYDEVIEVLARDCVIALVTPFASE